MDDITLDELTGLLLDAPPVELKGLALMRQPLPPGQVFPRGLPRETYLESVTEWMGYVNDCTKLAKTIIEAVPAVPSAAPVEEFPL
jgi:hypothetical protein